MCDRREGFVFWNETNRCYRVYTQVGKEEKTCWKCLENTFTYFKGPCPEHAWLIPADDGSGGGSDLDSDSPSSPASSVISGPGGESLANPPPEDDVFCECRSGFHFDPESYTCQPGPPGLQTLGEGEYPGGGLTPRRRRPPIALPLLPYQTARWKKNIVSI